MKRILLVSLFMTLFLACSDKSDSGTQDSKLSNPTYDPFDGTNPSPLPPTIDIFAPTSTCPTNTATVGQNFTCDQPVGTGNDTFWFTGVSHTCNWIQMIPHTGTVFGTPTNADVGTCILHLRVISPDPVIDEVIYTLNVVATTSAAPNPTALALNRLWMRGPLPEDSPFFSWTNPIDPDFDFAEVALGTSPLGVDIQNWTTSSNPSDHIFTALNSLTECTTYFPSVRSVDTLGIPSSGVSHPSGFRWDNTNPVFSGVIDITGGGQDTQNSPLSDWSIIAATDNCQFDHYEIAIGLGTSGAALNNVQNWIDIGTALNYQVTDGIDGASFTLSGGVNYFINVRAVDAVGFQTLVSSTPWQIVVSTPSPTVDIIGGTDQSSQDTNFSTNQTMNCPPPAGINRVLVVTVLKDDNNTAQVNSMISAGQNFTFVTGITANAGTTWNTRIEIWMLDEAGIQAMEALPTGNIAITWSVATDDKSGTCQYFEGIDQVTPIFSSNAAASTPGTAANINFNLNEVNNGGSFISCGHGANPTVMNIVPGIQDTLQSTPQGTQRSAVVSGTPVGNNNYNCTSNSTQRRNIVGVNFNPD